MATTVKAVKVALPQMLWQGNQRRGCAACQLMSIDDPSGKACQYSSDE